MTALPAGTVTFLFADVEASTRRWQEDSDDMRRRLAQHDAIWRAAIHDHNGVLFKHTGDGVAAVFASGGDAATAAVDAQLQLEDVFPVRVGLHTGEAQPTGADYFGPVLNRVAGLGGRVGGATPRRQPA